MKRIRFTLAMMALVLYSLTMNAQHSTFEVDGICYRLTSRMYRTVSVTYRADTCEKYAGDIVIPTVISYKDSEYKVLGITEGAFSECAELLSVTIPDEIQNIGNGAFEGCKKLSAIRIPEGVPSIGESMFKQCENLESIYIPNSVTGIGASAFAHCYNLDSISIPNSITSIGASAFANCRELNSFTVPTSVTSIGEMAFLNCYNLESLKVAEGNAVFDSRNNCNAIIMTASNTLIVACPKTIIPHDITTIGPNAFREMPITGLVLPEGLKTIAAKAFWGSSCDNALIIPESVDSIADAAFVLCDVDSIIIRAQISSLKMNTFEACRNLTYIELPNSLKYIGDHPFQDCENLQKIVCKASIPPKCTYWSFKLAGKRMTLEVPEESIELYKEATVWENFYCIKTENTEGSIKQPDTNRNIVKKGNGIYYATEDGECTYLYSYDYEYGDTTAVRTDFTKWERWDDAIIIDVDTIGSNAFSNCTFRRGQIIYLTDKVNAILEDAFSYVNIVHGTVIGIPDISEHITLVFEGEFPPNIDKDNIMNYDDSTCKINFAVPNIVNYITNDIQWTYTTLMTIDDLVRGYISPENEVTVNDSTEVDASVDNGGEDVGENTPTTPPTIRASVRPRGDIPVRIGEGENKDIYSRAPAWQYYTVEVVVTDCHADTLYTASQECRAHGQCDFVIELPYYPDGGYVYLHSRSIDMFGRATEWNRKRVNLIDDEYEGDYVTDANVDLNNTADAAELTATVGTDSIRITGYYMSNCGGGLYCVANARGMYTELIFHDGASANCIDYHYVDFMIPRFSEDIKGIDVVEPYPLKVKVIYSSITDIDASDTNAPYYDLMGRKVANPSRGIYIRNGRKVVVAR